MAYSFLTIMLIVLSAFIFMVNVFDNDNEQPRKWTTSIVDGTVSMLSFSVITSDVFYAILCTSKLFRALGTTNRAGAGIKLTAFVWSGAVLAAMNCASYVVSSHNDHGRWSWDN